ncbi:hypothetical protein GCM10009757_20800 [Streptomyces cheonanensis]|uniref:Uncharacterized protein n=1 Tax=Streptomyces cheonanensis TaxID=312720 RepID=A0ABN2V2T3_9ACTN
MNVSTQVWVQTDAICGWAEEGACLMCGRTGVLVMWLGPVVGFGRSRPFHACEPCAVRLAWWVREAEPEPEPGEPTVTAQGDAAFQRRYDTAVNSVAAVTIAGILSLSSVAAGLWLGAR